MLTTLQLRTLHRALVDAFDSAGFEELMFRIGVPLKRLVGAGASLAGQVHEVVLAAERAGWTDELVRAAYEACPQHEGLAEVYASLGFATAVHVQRAGVDDAPSGEAPAIRGLERVISRPEGLVDFGRWRERLTGIEARVCRVELRGGSLGTGFLVGPDTILTCYHVVREAIADPAVAETVRVRFDYRVVPGGVSEGVLVALHPTDWLVDWSASSPADNDGGGEAGSDELDYALLRLARPVGAEPVDPAGGGAFRGWIAVVEAPPALELGMPLVIAQYPRGGPLQIGIDSNALLGVSENGTRVRYTVHTEPGSAGGPCFDMHLELVAMHHARYWPSPGAEGEGEGEGEGIPIAAIRARLARVGTEGALGGLPPGPDAERRGSGTVPPAPGPVVDPEDPQRHRWGGAAERGGRKVTAALRQVERAFYTFDVSVDSTDDTALQAPVVFHLHDSYTPHEIWIRDVRNGRTAVFEGVQSYGVYTIGVQVKAADGTWIGLELDLSALEGLPVRFQV